MSPTGEKRTPKSSPDDDRALCAQVQSCWERMAAGFGADWPQGDTEAVERYARRSVELLLFLQLAEAKGMVPKNTWASLTRGRHPGRQLGRLTRALVDRFGPGLFSVGPGETGRFGTSTDDPIPPIDDRAVREAIGAPDADGRFEMPVEMPVEMPIEMLADRPVEILGTVHQWLLGRQLRRCRDGSYESSRSSQTKKRGGIFYTPDCVVRYIVRRLVAEPSGADVVDLRKVPWQEILDPACGCGWFLLAAYRQLLDGAGNRQLMPRQQAAEGLHGVDVDPDAVLAARRSLWIEMAQGQTDSVRRSLIETLTKNIQHGDVLTGDAFDGRTGQFDAILGNPPYRRELNTKGLLDRIAQTEFGRRWRSPRMDLWYYFVHRGLELLKPAGRLSFIVPSYWTAGSGSGKLIGALRESACVEEIFLLDHLDVFPGVSGRHMILTLTKGAGQRTTTIKRPATDAAVDADDGADAEPFLSGTAPLVIFSKTADQLFQGGRIDLERPCDELLEKLARLPRLDSLGKVRQGIAENPAAVTGPTNRRHADRWQTGEGVFALGPDELQRLDLSQREKELIRPYHDLSDLGRYGLAEEPSLSLIYSTRWTCPDIDRFPALREHLARFRPIMEARRETRQATRAWWQLHWPREEALWESPKLIALQMARRPSFAPAARPVYVSFSTNVFVPTDGTREHLHYFAGILNSRLIWKWYRHRAKRRGVGLELSGHVLRQTPIARINFSEPTDRARHDRLVELVDRMMRLTGRVRATPGTQPNDEIAKIDRQIDAVVYALYELTDAEIAEAESE